MSGFDKYINEYTDGIVSTTTGTVTDVAISQLSRTLKEIIASTPEYLLIHSKYGLPIIQHFKCLATVRRMRSIANSRRKRIVRIFSASSLFK